MRRGTCGTNRLCLLATLLTTIVVMLSIVDAAERSRPRNVVFILIDDLRYDTFSFMGHPFVKTPHIDRMARQGVQFTNAFVTTSLCSPARASFLTGQYMHHHGVIDNNNRMPERAVTFAQHLQRAGYATAFIGKWHMGGSSDEARPGFDHWVSFRGQGTYEPDGQTINVDGRRVPRTKYMTDELTEYATAWLAEQQGDKPFLLYLSHKGVHGLYDPAPRHRDVYRDAPYQPPATMANTKENRAGKPMWVQNQRNSWHGVDFPYHGRSGQTIEEMYRHYCEMILSIDDSVGSVLKTLEEQRLLEDTLVVFTSDGGHLWGEHGLIDKRCAYEPSMRIPLLAYSPGWLKSGTQVPQVVANIDVAPTLVELAGKAVPAAMDGHSLLPLLEGHVPDGWRDELLYEYYWEHNFPQTPTTFALRGDRYKLIQFQGIWDKDELYDLAEDSDERHNLILEPQHQQRVQRMRAALHEQLSQTGGLQMPLGYKRGHGANLRHADGAPLADFPERWIRGGERQHEGAGRPSSRSEAK